ncbi:MAG: hypothetical protein JSS30_06445 [Verrucomicrobia bacterium]|nr:hypothetical protein [Verrucomicrobiota bacterium]
MGVRALNLFEKSEFLLDSTPSGTRNFCVVGTYEGDLDSTLVNRGLFYLQIMHPLLQMSPNSAEKVSHFVRSHARCPLREDRYTGPDQWRDVVKDEVTRRFNKVDEPLWRITLLKGEGKGQLIVTFHHAIADGVCAMEVMNHLFSILSSLKKDEVPDLDGTGEGIPDLTSLYRLSPAQPTIPASPSVRVNRGCHTSFLHDIIPAENVVKWTKDQRIRMNATLLAALALAVRKVLNPKYSDFSAMTAVNFRSSFSPPISKETLGVMRTALSDKISVSKESDLAAVASTLHQGLYTQLQNGKHVANLKLIEALLEKGITGQELRRRSQFPKNGVCVTNVGNLEFSGDYGNLTLNDLFVCANAVPFLQNGNNFILATASFRGKLSMSLWYSEELVKESDAKAVLEELKAILSSL